MAGYPVEADVILTDKLKRFFRLALTKSSLSSDLRERIRKYGTGRRSLEEKQQRTVPYNLVKAVHTEVNEQDDFSKIYLHELLEDSDLHISELQARPKDPEYEARIEKLRKEQANREYAQMTKNVDFGRLKNPEASIRAEIRTVNNQLVAVLNFIITVVGSFAFAYKAVEYSMEKPNVPMQLCSGLVVGTVVFFADLYFLMKNTI